MTGRIVLFGATGYTGRLTAEALVERGAKPVLAARSGSKLADLAAELGGDLETAEADVARPETVRALVESGDVLLTTVGPFARFGAPALDAAVSTGATYIDSTGEPGFIREVFVAWGPMAKQAGCALLTACGYDWVPGNLAGALALREAGEAATRVEVGYFIVGRSGFSGGTRASAAGAIVAPAYTYGDGQVITERTGRRVKSFEVNGKRRDAVSTGTTEHFGLPAVHPALRDVDVYLGWFGPASRPMQALSLGTSLLTRVPGARSGIEGLMARYVKGSTGGPGAEERAQSRSHIVATAKDPAGRELATVHVDGVDGYTFTGRFLAWAADRAAGTGVNGTGALGPVEAFGLDELEAGCAEAGIKRA
jgi:short subunit dehydrogenase-like uncharacterized protein